MTAIEQSPRHFIQRSVATSGDNNRDPRIRSPPGKVGSVATFPGDPDINIASLLTNRMDSRTHIVAHRRLAVQNQADRFRGVHHCT
ncbi:MAG TPA: hypothetical protein VEI07_26825 [Planctomycetaceae bacterium]|nr:hypothetical protein [Planctomycetaceae bacterium]